MIWLVNWRSNNCK